MAMLDDVLGTAGRGAKNRIWALGRRRRGKLGTDLSSIGVSIGRFVAAALICTGAVLMMSGAASGLRMTPCITAPDTANAVPTSHASKTRGNWNWTTICAA